jgi:hypothetical protein
VRDVAPDLPAAFATTLQQAMDREPSRRPSTAGELLDRLEFALKSPGGIIAPIPWLRPMVNKGGVGVSVSALVVLVVGAAEVAWLLEGSGLSMVMHSFHSAFGH